MKRAMSAVVIGFLIAGCAAQQATVPSHEAATGEPSPSPSRTVTPAPAAAGSPTTAATPSPTSTPLSAACDAAFARAAAVDEMLDTVADLYPAVRVCPTIEQWVAASSKNPGAIAAGVDPREFLGNVCTAGAGGTLSAEPLCQQATKACKADPAFADLTYCVILSMQ